MIKGLIYRALPLNLIHPTMSYPAARALNPWQGRERWAARRKPVLSQQRANVGWK
jgi:hypothetical protein